MNIRHKITALLILLTLTVQAQVFRTTLTGFSVLLDKKWDKWNNLHDPITFDFNNDRIIIHSVTPRVYDIYAYSNVRVAQSFKERIYSTVDSSGEDIVIRLRSYFSGVTILTLYSRHYQIKYKIKEEKLWTRKPF